MDPTPGTDRTADVAPRASRIRVLAPELADQIAAGEVVERPASVVKELCENAIDAGARRVDVEVEAGGRRLIRVVDDGCGMTEEEARLALRRHATSKIVAAADLWGVPTFGFRGEALPSIAAVSRLTLSTRVPEAAAGFRLVVEGGRESDAREVGMAAGTQIEVRELFFNTPARQKFLKAEATEVTNVSEALLRLALAHPGVHLRLRSNGRGVLDLPSHRDLGERVRAALARRGAGVLHEAGGEEADARVRAYLAGPEEAATTPRNTFLFVGRRFVRDRSLLQAVLMAYGELLDKGRYPMAALFVDVPGEEIDVNVHPQKLEVRFARAQEVYGAVRHVLGAAIARAPWLSSAAASSRAFTLPPSGSRAEDSAGGAAGGAIRNRRQPSSADATAWDRRRIRGAAEPTGQQARDAVDAAGANVGSSGDGQPAVPGVTSGLGFFAGLAYLGQLHRTYLLCEAAGELVLIDQHAAHERIAFERIRSAHRNRSVVRQRLLFPIPVDVDQDLTGAAASAGEPGGLLDTLGFEVEGFGSRTLLVRAVPEILKNADPKPLLLDLLAQVADETHAPLQAESDLERVFATMACHSVVRAGDVLGREQALGLLRQMDDVDLRSHCPHGRPVLVRMPLAELERRFGRT